MEGALYLPIVMYVLSSPFDVAITVNRVKYL